MTLMKIKFVDVFIIFALTFFAHFIYNWFPNCLFSIFFPVNESVWEHMKIIATCILIISISDYYVFKKYNLKYNNFFTSMFLSIFLSIVLFLIIYLPFFYLIGENFFLNILILFIAICFSQFVSFLILNTNDYDLLNYISLIGIIFIYIVFGILTYYPPIDDIFYDKTADKYGINTYNV